MLNRTNYIIIEHNVYMGHKHRQSNEFLTQTQIEKWAIKFIKIYNNNKFIYKATFSIVIYDNYIIILASVIELKITIAQVIATT